MGESVSFKSNGGTCSGYLASNAANASAPGVVLIQEWWGLDDEIKNVASRLAKAGYRALVPDLYRGKLALEANEAEHLLQLLSSFLLLLLVSCYYCGSLIRIDRHPVLDAIVQGSNTPVLLY